MLMVEENQSDSHVAILIALQYGLADPLVDAAYALTATRQVSSRCILAMLVTSLEQVNVFLQPQAHRVQAK